MATYFFHLRSAGSVLRDLEGRSLDDLAAIASIALLEARAIISADALMGSIDLDQLVEVEDESGRLVHRLAFADAVAIRSYR